MQKEFIHIKSLQEYHRGVGLGGLKHPLMSVFQYENLEGVKVENQVKFTFDFYFISLKIDYNCKSQYGQTRYDFDEGLMGFTAPKQVHIIDENFVSPSQGWALLIHPDFLLSYPLATKIKDYGFFNYSVNEALILSETEEHEMLQLFVNINREYHLPIDTFSQDVLVSQLDLLLTLCNRYYKRQFITRKIPNSDLLSRVERILNESILNNTSSENGLISVAQLASQINISPQYLSDMLRQHTGQTAQQHIHDKVIERAKELLSATNLSVNEIAFQLGFEYAQSFSKLFKSKVGQRPLEFRKSFN